MIVLFPFLFLLGLCVGSFINCVVYRLLANSSRRRHSLWRRTATSQDAIRQPPRFSLVRSARGLFFGRSYCDHCKKALAWCDLIPLLSFVFLKGKCRYCGKKISWQYPVVEFATAITTLLVFFHLAGVEAPPAGGPPPRWPTLVFYLLLTYGLIIVFISDLKYQIIPDQVVYPAVGITLIYRLFSCFFFTSQEPPPAGGPPSEVFLSAIGAAGFFLLLYFLTKRKGMGLGDVKLAFLMGLLLGWPKILIAFYFAFLTGALIGVILILTGKKKFGQHIPFGPFLVGGTFISWLWGEKILGHLGRLGYL